MPAHPFYTNFTGGEVTQQLDARTDFEKYMHSAERLENFVVLPQGGIARRAGSIFLGEAKDPTKRVRLVPFEFSVTQAYMLEFGEGYIRFWANRARVEVGGVPVEVATPYTEAQLRELRFEQSADVLYIAHPAHAQRKLQRISATSFELVEMVFDVPPTFQAPLFPVANLGLTATTGVITAFADAGIFQDGDVGRRLLVGSGFGTIYAVGVAGTQAGVRVTEPYPSTGPFAPGEWSLDGSPNAGTLTPTAKAPINGPIGLTSSLNAWRTTDVGKFVYLNGGIVQIHQVPSATAVTGIILKELTTLDAAAVGTWTLESPAWSAELGFPGVVLLHAQRLWWAGSPAFPDRVWGSVVADYQRHARGANDDDAVVYQLASPGVNLIRWMKGGPNGIGLGTMSGETTLDSGSDAPLTPSSARSRDRTTMGADYTLDAARISDAVVFAQRGAQRIREFVYSYTNDSYETNDLTIIASHLTRVGIAEMAFGDSPEPMLFVVRADGGLAVLTYARSEKVLAWSRHTTDGLYESINVIPNACGTGDEFWAEVQRTVTFSGYWAEDFWAADYWSDSYWPETGTHPRRYIEVFDGNMNVDSGLTYTGLPADSFAGLGHLEGRIVKAVLADGTTHDLEVANGQITLPTGASTAALEVGLPFTSTAKLVRPEVAFPNGTIQGRLKRWARVTVRVFCASGRLFINGEQADLPEGETEPFTGDLKSKMHKGWDREGQITLQQADPKPVTILGVTGLLEVAND